MATFIFQCGSAGTFYPANGVTIDGKNTNVTVQKNFKVSITVPTSYTGNTAYFYSNDNVRPTPNNWFDTGTNKKFYVVSYTTATTVTTTKSTTGSLNMDFINVYGETLDSFKAIKGDLDGTLCANGDYADVAIPVIFNQLKNYSYEDAIFDNIKNNLAAFFTSIGFVKRIIQGTILLTLELESGAITLTQYQELLDKKYEEYASHYGTDYTDNYVKLAIAIEKYKYLLENTN
jgi:hypothetical protein